MTDEKKAKTLVLICRRDFCRVLDRVLRAEGLSDFQHGDLSMVGRSVIEATAEGATEVFLVTADEPRAERLIGLLRACPIRGGREEEVFELYIVGGD